MTSEVHGAMLGMLASVNDRATHKRIAQTIEKLIESYRTADVSARASLCDENIVFVDPVGLPEIRGREAISQFFRDCLAQGWSFSMTLDDLVICSNEALMTWVVDAEKAGEGSATLRSSNMMVFNGNGQIASWRAIFDENRIASGSRK